MSMNAGGCEFHTPYTRWAPTPFDAKGLGEDEHQKGWCVTIGRTRDSDCLTESNFEAFVKALAAVDPEGEAHAVHTAGHWGPGWFDIVLVKPGTKAHAKAVEMEGALANYPVLDDDDFATREAEAVEGAWANLSLREKIELCARFGMSIFAARAPSPLSLKDDGSVYDYLRG